MAAPTKAGFIEPMLLLRTDTLPDEGGRWAYQLNTRFIALREDKPARDVRRE